MFFQKYIEPLLKPFQSARSKVVQAKNVKGNIKVDVNRVGARRQAAQEHGREGARARSRRRPAQRNKQQAPSAQQSRQEPGGRQAQARRAVPRPGAHQSPTRRSRPRGLFWKKKFCSQCENELDKTWDACPYCAQAAADAAAANVPKAPMKTQAFMIGAGGQASSMQLLGWLVPVQGTQRGELFQLAPASSIGTDPGCTVVLMDKFMSSKHAEIKAEGGVWILKDLGSTNGTYVNDKRVDKHELVDNDFIKFGGSLCKFKSL